MKRRTQKLINLTYWSLFLFIAFMALWGVMNQIEAYENNNFNTDDFYLVGKFYRSNLVDNDIHSVGNKDNSKQEISPLCSLDAVICKDEKQGTIENLIAHYSDIYNFNLDTALRIADCESKTGKYLYNFSGSSAKGIYQFTDGTWKDYCKGDVLNAEDNIKCFLELYNQHPTWWECV